MGIIEIPLTPPRRWEFFYNAAGDLVEQRDPLGNSRLIAPDAAGRPVGFSSSTEYTPVDQPAASVDPLGERTGFAYDAAGRLASVTDARGTVLERYGYDAPDRLLTCADAISPASALASMPKRPKKVCAQFKARTPRR